MEHTLNRDKCDGELGEIESFISKVDAVNAAIRGMKEGALDPSEVRVEGIPTEEEERQMAEEKKRRKLEMVKREKEYRERRTREEHDTWWRGAELLLGDRKGIEVLRNRDGTCRDCSGGEDHVKKGYKPSGTRPLSEEEKIRLKERYSMEYDRWDRWSPADPATLAEDKEHEEEEESRKSKEFEESNPDFCSQMMEDMRKRSEAREKKETEASAARLKGNRFYKAKRWEKARELYMTSLKGNPYEVNTLANLAQTLIKLERWIEAVEFCDRALHINPKCVKALSRRASAFIRLAGEARVAALRRDQGNIASASEVGDQSIDHSSDSCQRSTHPVDYEIEAGVSADLDVEELAVAIGGGSGRNDAPTVAFRERYGGSPNLRALALKDLSTAVDIDPAVDDLRRQRDELSRKIEEARAEAQVMKRARVVHKRASAAVQSRRPDAGDISDGGIAAKRDRARDSSAAVGKKMPSSAGGGTAECHSYPGGDSDDRPSPERCTEFGRCAAEDMEMQMVDKLLDEALGSSLSVRIRIRQREDKEDKEGTWSHGGPTGSPLSSLERLRVLLEGSSLARVYLRSSGGLSRLLSAVSESSEVSGLFAEEVDEPHGRSAPWDSSSPAPHGVSSKQQQTSPQGATQGGATTKEKGNNDREGQSLRRRPSFVSGMQLLGSVLSVVAASLEGGEMLAQQEVWRSGLLELCAKATEAICKRHTAWNSRLAVGATAADADEVGKTSSSAAMVISRAIGDAHVRSHVARSSRIVSSMLGLIAAGSSPPTAIQAAAQVFRELFSGNGSTSMTATRTLQTARSVPKGEVLVTDAEAKPTEDASPYRSPVAILGAALQDWLDEGVTLRGAPAALGEALCGALANLAFREEFRGDFADKACWTSPTQRGGQNGAEAMTVVSVLLLVAGDRRSSVEEARGLALAALLNACLHTSRVQEATVSAGGLALSLAFLSLEGEARSRNVPPLVVARSAGLLARLCTHRAALDTMKSSAVVKIIMQAIVRSARLGGDVYKTSAEFPSYQDGSRQNATDPVERENLVRVLASILRSLSSPREAVKTPAKQVMRAPSSHFNRTTASASTELLHSALEEARSQGVAGALVSFLPPARDDGPAGVTRDSVALCPEWSAPPGVTANVCSCLLYLMGGKSSDFTDQVVQSGGIPRLISLFANSSESATVIVRKNAAICLAKIARQPHHKSKMVELRGMEMLLQAGPTLTV